eukprot:CAMPEP_0206043162 /NCGR_PEP_ID=MMETSP1466-20131121/7946_1 /ASSEMBLY_ACC=CAM_ASM_001126 /TAXON_ID=44452 /ORGANISM="Pavlova gyrans, Strain CCMP608" /LENGTH=53 /DNA_ID=CAMNT_0053417935 /DNA_START=418 /DNA_END=579 /DNA_ORIENTATION=-
MARLFCTGMQYWRHRPCAAAWSAVSSGAGSFLRRLEWLAPREERVGDAGAWKE